MSSVTKILVAYQRGDLGKDLEQKRPSGYGLNVLARPSPTRKGVWDDPTEKQSQNRLYMSISADSAGYPVVDPSVGFYGSSSHNVGGFHPEGPDWVWRASDGLPKEAVLL